MASRCKSVKLLIFCSKFMWLRGGGCLICPQHWIRESRVKCKHQEIPYKEWVKEIITVRKNLLDESTKGLSNAKL